MKKILLASAMFAAAFTAAYASDAVTFDADGVTWTVVGGGDGAPVSALHMSAGAAQACPTHTVKFDSVKTTTGGRAMRMTKDQKFRGDHRWHIVCVRDVPTPRS